jgi:hypothetical protein
MRFGLKEISDLTDSELIGALQNCRASLDQRKLASEHDKFHKDCEVIVNGTTKTVRKMEFPPINPQFILMLDEILIEIEKRKLEVKDNDN